MIQVESVLNVADKSGAKKALCIKVLGGSRKRYARIGDVIVVSIQSALPKARSSKVSKGEIYKAVVIRTKTGLRRPDGIFVRFNDNAIVLVDKDYKPISERVIGPAPIELRRKSYSLASGAGKNFLEILKLAEEVV
jgi:large subunit ribosomal protein L14